ncbi:MAG TPA: M1 family metallopeptidase [Chitinophagaceae bacterium]|nr:M1 family metallopeptidase [Chitinophagaceae bacterium]
MTRSVRTFILILLCAQQSLAQDRDISYMSSGGKLNPLQANMDIRHYTLALDVDPAKQTINGYCDIKLNLAKQADTLLFDLVHLLQVSKVKVNNAPANFIHQNDKIYITSSKGFAAAQQTVHIEYGGVPPVAIKPPWDGGFTWTKDSKGNPWVALNCQGEGGKLHFPCKDHPSDEPNEGVDMMITVPKGLAVAGPGMLQKATSKNNKTTYHWKTNYTISNYCVVFNIGKYKVARDSYTTINGNKVPIEYYVLEEDTAHAKKLIQIKIRDTRILEKYFGEYPWVKEKIGIAEVPNSGMEHQTMITFQNKFVYRNIGGQDYSGNLFHEYAHEWWANKVTNKDWAHMWIQEGIATYAEALAMLELGGEEAYNEMISRQRRNAKTHRPMVQGEEVTEELTYSAGNIYGKGSFFMHSLRFIIGDDVFFPTLKKLATDPAYTYDNFVTTSDVEQLFSKASGMDLKPYFDFYMRTIEVLDFQVKETGYQTYQVKALNYFHDLPLEITTGNKTERMTLTKDGITIKSPTPPLVDPRGFYMKKINY